MRTLVCMKTVIRAIVFLTLIIPLQTYASGFYCSPVSSGAGCFSLNVTNVNDTQLDFNIPALYSSDCGYSYYSGLYPSGSLYNIGGLVNDSCAAFNPMSGGDTIGSQVTTTGFYYYTFTGSDDVGYYGQFYYDQVANVATPLSGIGIYALSPAVGSTTSSSLLSFLAQTDGIVYSGFNVTVTNLDTLSQFTYSTSTSGSVNFSQALSLGNGVYQGLICLNQNPGLTSDPLCQNVTFTLNSSGLLLSDPYTNATSSFSIMPNVFGLVSTLANKFPFNWMFETIDILDSLSTSTATTTIPTVEVDFGGLHTLQAIPTTTTATTTFVLFSADTLQEVSEFTAVQAMRTLLSYILWFSFMLFSYRIIKGVIKTA